MDSEEFSISADFLEHNGRKLFSILLRPVSATPRGAVLYLPPFAEEMHRSRHIVAAQARELAAIGYNVLLLDLYGCGDSGGEFSDANWSLWLQDATFGINRLKSMNHARVLVWGVRMGALLGSELARSRMDISKLVLWQPALNGEQQIDQFLRLRTVPTSAMEKSQSFDRSTLWNELRAGRSLEVAGYELSSQLALEMAGVRLNEFAPVCPVAWFDINAMKNRGLGIASGNVVRNWRLQGVDVEVYKIVGEPFWRMAEACINRELLESTAEWLQR
ncbi:MAG: hydrolase 2, exosortase A system-associated [Halioglobus sp.]|nr:hydrolase 2, exosortase A system-associated [Halioglobus sp.]